MNTPIVKTEWTQRKITQSRGRQKKKGKKRKRKNRWNRKQRTKWCPATIKCKWPKCTN